MNHRGVDVQRKIQAVNPSRWSTLAPPITSSLSSDFVDFGNIPNHAVCVNRFRIDRRVLVLSSPAGPQHCLGPGSFSRRGRSGVLSVLWLPIARAVAQREARYCPPLVSFGTDHGSSSSVCFGRSFKSREAKGSTESRKSGTSPIVSAHRLSSAGRTRVSLGVGFPAQIRAKAKKFSVSASCLRCMSKAP